MGQVYILGAGTPTPTATRFGSAHVVEVAGDYLMFDCGPAATHKLVKAGLFPTKVDYLHPPSFRPRCRLPLLPALPLGSEHWQREPTAGLRTNAHRDHHRAHPRGERRFRP
jgi:hypothetical protein